MGVRSGSRMSEWQKALYLIKLPGNLLLELTLGFFPFRYSPAFAKKTAVTNQILQ